MSIAIKLKEAYLSEVVLSELREHNFETLFSMFKNYPTPLPPTQQVVNQMRNQQATECRAVGSVSRCLRA